MLVICQSSQTLCLAQCLRLGLSPAGDHHQSEYIGMYSSQEFSRYRHGTSAKLGYTHVAAGLLCCIFGCAAIGVRAWGQEGGQAIWGGVAFIMTGVYALQAAKLKVFYNIAAHCYLAFFSLWIAAIGYGLAIAGMAEDELHQKTCVPVQQCKPNFNRDACMAMNGMLMCLFNLELITCIWSCWICITGCKKDVDPDQTEETVSKA
ncbi:hypothetical protein CAPTEDRAFT_186587 [Capitella teleta]|uniref:MARVEL domain-containing protein n=1 Tax=Capitella teleta TaxID=283909 RepID=R7UB67_CAPTE|nr:hypothetical protein CAPTEDRAFT_186587 [Capitella teleta]|eukprot:ELU01038.1 hypothetical protein CAPTEDRAFT_186587 [Capitella teleta]